MGEEGTRGQGDGGMGFGGDGVRGRWGDGGMGFGGDGEMGGWGDGGMGRDFEKTPVVLTPNYLIIIK